MFSKGQYVLYCMFPEKGQTPNEIVRIAGTSEPECGKARYGIEYAKWDMENLKIRVEGGSSWSWDEDCFAEISDPVQKLIAKRQENSDKIQKLKAQIEGLEDENAALYFSLGVLVKPEGSNDKTST